MQPIQEARNSGFSDEEILAYLQQQNETLAEPINQALQTGFSASEVLEYITNAGSPKTGKQIQRGDTSQMPQQQRGFFPAIARGFKGSVTGLVGGADEQVAPEDETFVESLGELAGGLVGDVPAMFAGGAAGGAAGTAIAPGLGTVVGAGAGSFALPAIIKQAFAEYRDYAKQGGAGTFGEFLERIGRVGATGVKSGTLGALTSQASRLLPVLKRMPRFAKLLNTRIGKALEEPVAELATLTAGEAAIEGKIPTPEDIGRNIFAITGFRAVKGSLAKASELAQKYTPFEAAARLSSKAELERRKAEIEDNISTEAVEVEAPEPVAEPKPEQQEQLRILEREIAKREKAAAKRKEIADKAKEIGTNVASKLNSLLPESSQRKIKSVIDDLSQRKQRWNDKKETAKREIFVDMVKKHYGKKAGELIRSHYKWREALETPIDTVDGKPVMLSDQNLQDMMFYRQKTHNPNIEGDTFEALSERLPEKAKKIVNETVDEHFKTWVQRWNDNPATLHKINPREGLEDIYLPGIYEETSKSKYTDAMKAADEAMRNYPDQVVRKQFKLKGPFANAKVFETYADAIEKAGLTPRYKNLKDLLRYHDELMVRLEANNELMARIREWQDNNGEKVIVNSNKREAYEQAKKDGWVPFEDKFLRMLVRGTDEEGKPQWEVSPDRALVDPTFAKVFKGIFNKDAYKPDNAAWKLYDTASNLMKVMRVSLSPFHIIALAESGIGGLGTDFFSRKWWKEASKSFDDIDKVAWRAEMGLSFKIPDTATYEEGQAIFEKITNEIPSKESKLKIPFKAAAKLIQKQHKWIFEQYQPRLKIATFDKYLADVIERKAKVGENITQEVIDNVAREVADVVNDQFGGQIWETKITPFFDVDLNDPKTQKWMRRAVGYPDWSVSAIRQATGAFTKGIRGDLAREYWIRYGLGMMATTYAMRFLYGGLTNKKDEKNKFTWDPKKAFQSLNTKDPNALYSFPLPDVNLEIAGVKFNPGRDEKGRRQYAHVGKQALEVPRYATDTFDSLFSKSNPVIQSLFKQIIGGTPYKGEIFPARGKFKAGQFLPWNATLPGTPSRAKERLLEFAGDFVPFSFRGLGDKGIATTLATGLGAVPVRKGLSLKASEPYIIDAIRTKNPRKLKQVVDTLKDNGYDDKQIRNRIRLIKKFWVDNKDLDKLIAT